MFDWVLHEFLWKNKVRMQVLSYKQKTMSVEQHHLCWPAVSLRIDFPPSYGVFFFFAFFAHCCETVHHASGFSVWWTALYIVLIKYLLDKSLYLGELPPRLLSFIFLMMVLICFLTGAMNHVGVNRSLSRSACSQDSGGEQMIRCFVDEELL